MPKGTVSRSLLIRFESGGRALQVTELNVACGIVFDTHPYASPLNVALGVQPRLPQLLEPVRRRNGWEPGVLRLGAEATARGLRLGGYNNDPNNLPAGIYDVSVEVESYDFENALQTLEIPKTGEVEVTLRERPDLRRVKLRGNFDPETQLVLDNPQSQLDDQPVRQWLDSPTVRESRKACLLNVLTKLRVLKAPAAGFATPLTSALKYVYFGDVDRIYAAVHPDLSQTLELLKAKKLWVREGRPQHPIHQRLLDLLVRLNIVERAAIGGFKLVSYRQGGRNCLQIVLAIPPAGFSDPTLYADIDIDLGNPLWDIEGVVVHLSEVLDSGRTDHLKLHDRLDRDETRDFMFYDVVKAEAART